MNKDLGSKTLLEKTIKECLVVNSPKNLTMSVMNEIMAQYVKTKEIKKALFVLGIILFSILIMVGILFLFTIIPFSGAGQSDFVIISFKFMDILKIFPKIWKVDYVPIFTIAFSLVLFIDVFFFRKKKSVI